MTCKLTNLAQLFGKIENYHDLIHDHLVQDFFNPRIMIFAYYKSWKLWFLEMIQNYLVCHKYLWQIKYS